MTEEWSWRETQVARAGTYLSLTHDYTGDEVLAFVGPPSDAVFPVEMIRHDAMDDATLREVETDVRRELDYYLLEVGGDDPWEYAIYHCGTAANAHSNVHWGCWQTAETRFAALVDRAWHLFGRSLEAPDAVTVQPSMPILYFGDRGAYECSPTRIVTVGLNPSLSEFPADNPWLRFPAGAALGNVSVSSGLTDEQRQTYVASLNEYFARKPYDEWFGRSFDRLLRAAGASYYADAAPSVALHTDIASPVATKPTWSGLKREERRLYRGGAELWRDLVEALEPDVILISVAREHLSTITPLPFAEWPESMRIEAVHRAQPYIVSETVVMIAGKQVLVVFGRCVNVPFGSVDFAGLERIGRRIAERLAVLRAEQSPA
jgi:hypothetical protein